MIHLETYRRLMTCGSDPFFWTVWETRIISINNVGAGRKFTKNPLDKVKIMSKDESRFGYLLQPIRYEFKFHSLEVK